MNAMRIVASAALVLLGASAAYVLVAAPPPGPVRIARADTVVLGPVVAHEDKDVEDCNS